MAIKRPKLKFLKGNTYVIDQSDASNANHPLRFTADSGATEYTHGVTATGTPGQAGATVTFNVPDSAPENIMYYCSTHGLGMGNHLKTINDPNINYWGGPRGFSFAGNTNNNSSTMNNNIDYFDTTTPSNATDFGDLTEVTQNAMAAGNTSRILRMSGSGTYNTIDYITSATIGNALDFGDLAVQTQWGGSASDGTNAFCMGGNYYGLKDEIQYVAIATTGDASSFGNLVAERSGQGSINDTTRAISAGGTNSSGQYADIDYFTMATPGNASDFGDMIVATMNPSTGTISNDTRGLIIGGIVPLSSSPYLAYETKIEYITIQTPSNATSFGDLSIIRGYGAACSSELGDKGFALGANIQNGNTTNSIEAVTISTTGNATDFGDLVSTRSQNCGASGAAA